MVSPSEPQTEVTPEKHLKSEPNPEPLPEWETAFQVWSSWWEIHNYGFGCVFAILAVFCVFCLIRLRVSQTLTLGRYFTAVTALLLVFTFTRALYLFLDPYEAHKALHLPVVVVRVLFALGYPCLTSVFSLINFAFVKVNNLWVILKRLQNVKFLSAVITVHFLLVLIVYLVVTFSPQMARLFILCQVVLIVWWMLLVIFFVYSAWLVITNEKRKTKYINRNSKIFERSGTNTTEKQPRHDTESHNSENINNSTTSKGTKRIVRISGVVAIAGLISVVLEFYSLFGVYKLYALQEKFVKPWPWWGYQTGSRAVEVCLCCIVAYVVYPTIRRRHPADTTVNSQITTMSVSSKKVTTDLGV
jgi:hypothetical protein